jgi:hypothetical protein
MMPHGDWRMAARSMPRRLPIFFGSPHREILSRTQFFRPCPSRENATSPKWLRPPAAQFCPPPVFQNRPFRKFLSPSRPFVCDIAEKNATRSDKKKRSSQAPRTPGYHLFFGGIDKKIIRLDECSIPIVGQTAQWEAANDEAANSLADHPTYLTANGEETSCFTVYSPGVRHGFR